VTVRAGPVASAASNAAHANVIEKRSGKRADVTTASTGHLVRISLFCAVSRRR
jgi:hypothetical protein